MDMYFNIVSFRLDSIDYKLCSKIKKKDDQKVHYRGVYWT